MKRRRRVIGATKADFNRLICATKAGFSSINLYQSTNLCHKSRFSLINFTYVVSNRNPSNVRNAETHDALF